MANLHDFEITSIEGQERSLADLKDKLVLIVNVASKCGLTPQYEGLQRLYDLYAPRGLEILGFPCNQFAGQEPGSNAEVKDFCETNFGVRFPLAAKIDVNGADRHPLYTWLTSVDTKPDGPGDIKWNFAKFLVGKDGELIGRFPPTTEPQAAELVAAIESGL